MPSIWDDTDIQKIVQFDGGQPVIELGQLEGHEQEMMLAFVELDESVTDTSPRELVLNACLEGIRVTERLPNPLPGTSVRAWKKFVIYMTAANAQILWDRYQDDRASAVGGWVLETLKQMGVQPDGFATALGTAYSSTMTIHGSATTRDQSGSIVVRGGNDGRALAGL